MKTTDLKIERIEKPTVKFFQKYIATSRQPVIITGATSNWQACSSWTDVYLNDVIGNIKVKICTSQNSVFVGDPEDGYAKSFKIMRFSDFISLLRLNRYSKDTYYYLAQASIPQLSPKLLQDIKFPVYCKNKLWHDDSSQLWLGSSGNISSLHYDMADNILVQVKGSKRFVFFAPKQTNFLYPFPVNCQISHFSQVDIDRPDLKQFPNFSNARAVECVLKAGEMIFIPAFWWHQVYSLDDAQFPTISVNFWYKAPPMQLLTPSGRRYVTMRLWRKVLSWRRFKLLTNKIYSFLIGNI